MVVPVRCWSVPSAAAGYSPRRRAGLAQGHDRRTHREHQSGRERLHQRADDLEVHGNRANHERDHARLLLLVVEADEEVRAHARQLPEDEERDRVVGKHEAEHRRHEEQGPRVEAAQPWVALEVPPP